MSIKVSIIIPVYNVEKYLKQCVESAINQTFKDIEVILVNDGSTDNCSRICDEYAENDERIKVIHKENGGLSSARNAGFAACSGEYVYFLDSDDYIADSAIEILYNHACENESEVVFFDSISVSESGTEMVGAGYHRIRKHRYDNESGIEVACKLLSNGEYRASVPLLFIKKDLLEKNHITFYPGIFHEDELFAFLVFGGSNKVSHCPQPLFYRRIRPESIMTSGVTERRFAGVCTVYFEMLKYYADNIDDITRKKFAERFLAYVALSAMRAYYETGSKERPAVYGQKKEIEGSVKKARYYGSHKLRFMCKCPRLYMMLRKMTKEAKNI